jgi:hypothetical protein
MSETKQVLCGQCHVNVEQGTDPNGQETATCPQCGRTDTLENAIREATEYFTDKLTREMLSPLDSIPSNDFVKVTVTYEPERIYRFILE